MTATTTADQMRAEVERGLVAGTLDDTTALVWADALDESRDHARAEFVRVTVELNKATCCDPDINPGGSCYRKDCPECAADALLREHEAAWRASGPCAACGGTRRVRETPTGGSKPCPECRATGDRGGLLRHTGYLRPGQDWAPVWSHTVHWRAGLPYAVECRLEDVFERVRWANNALPGMWRPTAWALAVAKWHPITEFRITDREPWRTPAIGKKPRRFTFGPDNGPNYEYVGGGVGLLPHLLYTEYMRIEGDSWRYESPEAAKHALAVAAGVVVRRALEG